MERDQAAVMISKEVHKKLKVYCAENELSMTELVEELIYKKINKK